MYFLGVFRYLYYCHLYSNCLTVEVWILFTAIALVIGSLSKPDGYPSDIIGGLVTLSHLILAVCTRKLPRKVNYTSLCSENSDLELSF